MAEFSNATLEQSHVLVDAIRAGRNIVGFPAGSYNSQVRQLDFTDMRTCKSEADLIGTVEYFASYFGVSPDAWHDQFLWVQEDDMLVKTLTKESISRWPLVSSFGEFVVSLADQALFDDDAGGQADFSVMMRSALGYVMVGAVVKDWRVEVEDQGEDNIEQHYSMAFDLSLVPQA